MAKTSIVGVEGSGKTVLMAALAEKYGEISEDKPYLMPENQSAFSFMTHVPHLMRQKRQWPQATTVDSLRLMRWSLRQGEEVISSVDLLDYPGELYRLAFGERTEEEVAAHRSEVHEFLGHLTDSDTIIVLLNLKDILDIGESARNTETVWITRGILDYAKKLPNVKNKVLVFTQADRYRSELESSGGPEGLIKKHLPMLTVLHKDIEAIAIAAVDGVDQDGNPRDNYASSNISAIFDLLMPRAELVRLNSVGTLTELEQEIQNIETTMHKLENTSMRNKQQEILRPYKHLLSSVLAVEGVQTTVEFGNQLKELELRWKRELNWELTEDDVTKQKELASDSCWYDVIKQFSYLPCATKIIDHQKRTHKDVAERLGKKWCQIRKDDKIEWIITGGVVTLFVTIILLLLLFG